MSTNHQPRVVIGMPVYNGENYIRDAIDSILAQTFTDFRLLISDNASTDSTEDICREYASKDNRIIYHRQEKNIGAAPNCNYVFQPDGAPYFKWAAHDDVLEPDYLLRCVELLDRDPSLAIAHSPSFDIDNYGNKVGTYDDDFQFDSPNVGERVWRILWTIHFTDFWGLMRTDFITKTSLNASYVGSDRNFTYEMLLQGPVGYTNDRLFCRRSHPESYMAKIEDHYSRLKWYDPEVKKISEPVTGLIKVRDYLSSLFKIPMALSDRFVCLGIILEWTVRRSIEMQTGSGELYRKKLFPKATHLN
ncbi:MAG: glycosyltransferase family A protein [Calothrix sp. MO_192.B10]|nr:glycosyltransferase family A protein [Calothrix sp. MO_192.B10]